MLEFAVAQHTDAQLRDGHGAVVEAFRAARPADAHGRHRFDKTATVDALSVYVCSEVGHHIGHVYDGKVLEVSAISDWLGDMPQDEIVRATGRVLGRARCFRHHKHFYSSLSAAVRTPLWRWQCRGYGGAPNTDCVGLSGSNIHVKDSLCHNGDDCWPLLPSFSHYSARGSAPPPTGMDQRGLTANVLIEDSVRTQAIFVIT